MSIRTSAMNNIRRLIKKPYIGKLKACILDWSGTTIDPFVIAPAVAFVDVFKKHSVSISMEEARIPMGLRKDLHIAKILEMPDVRNRWFRVKGRYPCSEDVDMLFNDFVPLQNECLPKYTGLLPDVVDVSKILREKYKLKIGTTTGFTESMVDIILQKTKEQGYYPDTSVAGDQVRNNMGFRPAPFMVYENLLRMGIFPIQSVVKVDDTISGVGEGINAGCWAVGVANWSNYMDIDSTEQWSEMSHEERKQRENMSRDKLTNESNAHYVIDDLTQLPDVIDDINTRMAKGENP